MTRVLISIATGLLLLSCGSNEEQISEEVTLDQIAEEYVKLSLEIGFYDPDYIDAYYGPDEWRLEKLETNETTTFPYDELKWKTSHLLHQLEDFEWEGLEELEELRANYLYKQLWAAKTKLDVIAGEKLLFDKESKSLYDAVSPHNSKEYYDELLIDLDKVLPGYGDISERYEKFSAEFIIPKDRLDTIFKTAIAEARKRTLQYIDLPENENFKLEYVTGKSWSGYNWYKGNYYSLIQINTDLPIYIDRAIDLASHEGYPGHHVYNVLLEKTLVQGKGWIDFSIYPLFSPQSLIAEGTANYGIEMVFPGEERLNFEKEILYPLAGIDPSKAQLYFEIEGLRNKLSYAENEAARDYLDGEITREKAVEWLQRYNLNSHDRAIQRTRFFDQYRSYVINYNWGKDLVGEFVERKGFDDLDQRWAAFVTLLSTPRTASQLTKD